MCFFFIIFLLSLLSCGLFPQDDNLTYAIAPVVGAAMIGAGSQLVSGIGSAMTNAKSYTKWRKSYDHAHRGAIEDWNMQNQYNLPVNQVNRLLAAGINPNMGNVDAAGGVISPSSGTNIPQENPLQGFENLPNQLGSLSDVQNTEANTQNVIANTAKTNSETIGQNIQNTIQTETGIPMARKNLEKLGYETMEFKERAEYQRILTSKAGQQIELALRESRERGEQLHLDNLIKTNAFDNIVASYGYENAFKYAMTKLTEAQTKYVGYNAESQRMSAIAQGRQADAAVTQAQTQQAMLPFMQAYSAAQTKHEKYDAASAAISFLVDKYAYDNNLSQFEKEEGLRILHSQLLGNYQDMNIKSLDEFMKTLETNGIRFGLEKLDNALGTDFSSFSEGGSTNGTYSDKNKVGSFYHNQKPWKKTYINRKSKK